MTTYQWFLFFLVLQVVHFLGTWKLYEAAGRKRWEAAIPLYNAIVLMKIINRPTWWTLLLFVPVVNLIMLPVVWVETLRSFGKNTTLDTVLGVCTFGLYIFYVNYTQPLNYIHARSLEPQNKTADTVSSILFAIVVATLVHGYVMQPYNIPTSSLEKSLLVGDFLFVSKFHFGARPPMTTVAAPMVHDTIPFINKKSYSSWPQLPNFRFPGIEKPKKNDIVVFNWPVDTVYFFRDASGRHVEKPIDKKSNYVKRCVGTPGDKIQIKNSDLYVNDKLLILSDRAKPQFAYTVKYKYSANVDYEKMAAELNDYPKDRGGRFNDSILYFPALTEESVKKLKTYSGIIEVKKIIDTTNTTHSYDFKYDPNIKDDFLNIISRIKESKRFTIEERENNIVRIYNLPLEFVSIINNNKSVILTKEVFDIFPNSIYYKDWTKDNFGPIYIPEAGKKVELNLKTLPFYKRIITVYEKNDLKINGDEIRINGQVATSYTFKQNYYWMMGDNRHNSEDSRYWGYVPEDHIVGKPVFIWMSLDQSESWSNITKKIRWDRLFTTVGGDGQPQSYFKYFLIALALYFGVGYFMNKRKEKNS